LLSSRSGFCGADLGRDEPPRTCRRREAGELLRELDRLRAGQQRLQDRMREGQTWDDRWLSSEALLTQEEIRECFSWKLEPPKGARPFCTCKHTLKRHPDGGPCEYCKGSIRSCNGYTPEGD